ncbi:MAG: transketolase [Acidimicrobiales bacterium]|nr:transketolase [Acidimicrobiales bacterium]
MTPIENQREKNRVDTELDQRSIAVIRGLALDGPHAARSGHQGTAMALAPLAHVLWTRVMKYDASEPEWADRDRFILSPGHASILLYSMLHLSGHGLTLDDIKDFRQWQSATPGHPEVGHTAGVEVTTGPLGQGFAHGVGMAIAEQSLRARFGAEICDHHIFAMVSDGDLAEGVSHEAASLAGHLGLGRLVYVYDDNHISIDGPTEISLSDDAPARFRAYGWHVIDLGEAGEDLDALETALLDAKAVTDQPSLIVVRTHIGYPSPDYTDHHEAHGYALKDEEITATKAALGIPDEPFYVPDDVVAAYRECGLRGGAARAEWAARLAGFSGDRAALDASLARTGVDGWAAKLPTWDVGDSVATRKASGACVSALADVVPGLMGGGADLTGNTGTKIPGDLLAADNPAGRQIAFGVREHAMGSILNGMALHGGTVPLGGTFLVFSDYMRPAVRLAALMQSKSLFVWTHDSVGVGEDGPTHQPVEHVSALRAIPHLPVVRPADANEVNAMWRAAIDGDGPVAMILTRQDVPVLDGTADAAVEMGAYVLRNGGSNPAVVLAATGSEVAVCVEAAEALAADGVAARVVSMPCWEWFEAQDASYQRSVFPRGVPTLGVEAGVSHGWYRYADDVVAIDRFGASAPGATVLNELGINADNVVSHARSLLA